MRSDLGILNHACGQYIAASCAIIGSVDRLFAMQAFAAVADARGFTPAAKRLGVSPSAVTRLVAALEDHLGVRLLARTTRSVALTDAGTRYLERTRALLASLVDAEAAARSERSEPFGRFVVAAPATFGRREVAPLISELLRLYPAISGELVLSDQLVSLSAAGVDLAVRIGQLEDSSLRVLKVGATRRVLVASPTYLRQRGRPKLPADLVRHATISFTSLSPTPDWRFHGPAGARTVSVRPQLSTNSADAAVAHAVRGGGIALVVAYQAADAIASGALEVLLPKFEPPPSPIQVVVPPSPFPSANVRAFMDLIARRARWDFVSLKAGAKSRRRAPP